MSSYKKTDSGGEETEKSSSEEGGKRELVDPYFYLLSNLLRHYPNMSVLDARRTTIAEYEVLMEAVRLRGRDDLKSQHIQAWLNMIVQGTKKVGKEYKPVYRKFHQFYDEDELVDGVTVENEDKKDGDSELMGLILEANKEVD